MSSTIPAAHHSLSFSSSQSVLFFFFSISHPFYSIATTSFALVSTASLSINEFHSTIAALNRWNLLSSTKTAIILKKQQQTNDVDPYKRAGELQWKREIIIIDPRRGPYQQTPVA